MKKSLASRIIRLAAIYCAVFCSIVILQFSGKGNFNLTAGSINIKGRYLQDIQTEQQEKNKEEGLLPITSGVKLFYGGLEFNLKEERGKGLTLTSIDENGETNSDAVSVNPEFMTVTDNSAQFILPGGTTITFTSFESDRGHELQINAEFADNVSEIIIPITPRRSSLVKDNEQTGILFSGNRYFFNNPGIEIEKGKIILSNNMTFVSYRARSKQPAFNPADFIIPQSQNYETVVRSWQSSSFTYWNQNAMSLQAEDDIIAYLSESLTRGNFATMVNTIPGSFLNSTRHSHRSAVYIGGMVNAYRSFNIYENEKTALINRLIRERSLDLLKEKNILDHLFSRNNIALVNELIVIITEIEPEMINIDYCAGLLEIYSDLRRWLPGSYTNDPNYPIGHLTEQIILLISENLSHDSGNDLVNISTSESINAEYNLRLGKALDYWAQNAGHAPDWSLIGKSLVLSAISDNNSGNLYNTLNLSNYYPRATVLLPESGHWAWTVSPSVRATYIDGNLNIAFNFPANASHYAIIRGVRPFIKIQFYGMDWRTDGQFERYDSSGWVYYPQDQTLVLKVRHRELVENVRIFYRVEEPPPIIIVPAEPAEEEFVE